MPDPRLQDFTLDLLTLSSNIVMLQQTRTFLHKTELNNHLWPSDIYLLKKFCIPKKTEANVKS